MFNFGNLKKEKLNIEVSKNFNFGNLKNRSFQNLSIIKPPCT